MRLKVIGLIISALFIILVLELFYVQVIRGRYYYNLSMNNRIRVVALEGWRGRIKDRNGRILSDNKGAYNVMITPQDVDNLLELFVFLGKILKEDPQALMKTYQKRKFTPFAPVTIAENISKELAIKVEENKFRFPCLIVQESFKRYYPFGRDGAHVLGYVAKVSQSRVERFKKYGYSPPSMVGYLGVEEYYDEDLRGKDGGLQIEVNSRGQQVRLLSIKEPAKGEDIVLTIDAEIQHIAQEIMESYVGTTVVMDLTNGEILGLVSSPSFDPNYFVEQKYEDELKSLLRSPNSPMLNRAIKGQYPPGSVFKVIMAYGGLESKKISEYTKFNCPGFFTYGGATFGDTCRYGDQDLIQSIAHSCNVYFYNLGLLLGADLIYKYSKEFSLGDATGVDLPYEEKGFIPSRKEYQAQRKPWYAGNTINMSIGQGDVLATPLQMVRMMGSIANDGIEVQPHLIKQIGDKAVEKYLTQKDLKVDRDVLGVVKRGIREVVTDSSGTGHDLNMPDLFVAGKTGTAQSSHGRDHHAWFVGYAKGKQRNIAFCVFLEHGGSSHNATPLARDLLQRMVEAELL